MIIGAEIRTAEDEYNRLERTGKIKKDRGFMKMNPAVFFL